MAKQQHRMPSAHEIDKSVQDYLSHLELSTAMKDRIAAGEINEAAVRKKTCQLAVRLFRFAAPLSKQEDAEYLAAIQQGLIDPNATITNGLKFSVFGLLALRHNSGAVLQAFLPMVTNPNEMVPLDFGRKGYAHPLELAGRGAKFQILLADPRIDLTMGKSYNALDRHWQNEWIKCSRELLNIRDSNRFGLKKDRLIASQTQRLYNVGKIIDQLRSMGVTIGHIDHARFDENDQKYGEVWEAIGQHKIAPASLDALTLKHLAGYYGMSAVFSPERWQGTEPQAVAALQTFHPSLQSHAAREIAVLQQLASSPLPWRMRVSAPSIREQGM